MWYTEVLVREPMCTFEVLGEHSGMCTVTALRLARSGWLAPAGWSGGVVQRNGSAAWSSRVVQQGGSAGWSSRIVQQDRSAQWSSRVVQQDGSAG